MIDELEKKLECAQSDAVDRTLTADDVSGWIAEVEKVVKAFPPEFRGMAVALWNPWTRTRTYESCTQVVATFTKAGDVDEVTVRRVGTTGINRIWLDSSKIDEYIRDVMGVPLPYPYTFTGDNRAKAHTYMNALRDVRRQIGADETTGYIELPVTTLD